MDEYIPFHLITEILLKLPLKSLVKFRFVSKSWLSLISSPHFNRAYLKNHKSPHNQRLLTVDDLNNFKHCSLDSLLHGQISPHVTDLDVQIPPGPSTITRRGYPYIFVKIIGCCDGLICIFARGVLGDHPDFILWNPSIGNYKKLSSPTNSSSGIWGFGYDGSSDDYKVVAINGLINGKSGSFQTRAYNVKTEAWRRIEVFPGVPSHMPTSGVLLEGKLHFLASDVLGVRYVASLDLATETYGKLEIPSHKGNSRGRLGEIGGNLFWYEPYLQGRHLRAADIWIMKEYGKSWTKVITLSIQPSDFDDPKILHISSKCELLILVCQRIKLLHKSREGRDFKELKNVVHAIGFVESLTWPWLSRIVEQ